MQKTIKIALLTFFLSSAPANALPYTPFPQEYKWLENHQFFPASQIFGGGSTMAFRALTDNRTLGIQIGYNADFDSAPNVNKILVETEEIAVLDGCSSITPFGLLQSLSLENSDCQLSEEFIPLNIKNSKLQKVIQIVYGASSEMITKDLTAAKMVFQGKRYFKIDGNSRKILKNGPIDFQFFKGSKFHYVLTPFALLVSMKDIKYIKDLMNEIHADEKLYKSVMDDIQRQKDNSRKEIPYDL